MYAIIDIGSNTIRLAIYEVRGQGNFSQILHIKSFAGLAGCIDARGCMTPAGIMEVCKVLHEYKEQLSPLNIIETHVIAGAAFRNIKNADLVVSCIEDEIGFDTAVLSGESEALYAYIGATHEFSVTDGIVADIGGGSTEIVCCRENEAKKAVSFPIGSLSMYVENIQKVLPSRSQITQIKNGVLQQLEMAPVSNSDYPILYGVGGSIRAICRLYNSVFKHPDTNRMMEARKIKKLRSILAHESQKIILLIIQIAPERIHTILPGMIILDTIIKHYNCKKMFVGQYGLREGYLIHNVLKNIKGDEHCAG
jgi:exopolyphosphatase/guanosine-5'-triphosphate,3'-diphosphate pyrophosphatase